jgi:hypothetical protein
MTDNPRQVADEQSGQATNDPGEASSGGCCSPSCCSTAQAETTTPVTVNPETARCSS